MNRPMALAAVAALVPFAATSETVSSKGRVVLFESQTSVLDSRAAEQYRSSVRLQPPRVVTPTKWGDSDGSDDTASPRYEGSYKGEFAQMARDAARRNGVPEDLFLRLVQQESNWNPTAKSHKGAYGLAQLMPGTARELGVDPKNPAENLEGGARYLRTQYKEFGTWKLALAAYNAGPGAVRKHGGVPPFRETRNYVRIIAGK